MPYQTIQNTIDTFLEAFKPQITRFMGVPEDACISNGNVAVCLIDAHGGIHGQCFGTDPIRQRQSFQVAWRKASLVWLTGTETGEYERMVFTGQVPENANGIDNPDLIGWVGGQPVTLNNGLTFSVGFSGFRGSTDKQIVLDTFRQLNLINS